MLHLRMDWTRTSSMVPLESLYDNPGRPSQPSTLASNTGGDLGHPDLLDTPGESEPIDSRTQPERSLGNSMECIVWYIRHTESMT